MTDMACFLHATTRMNWMPEPLARANFYRLRTQNPALLEQIITIGRNGMEQDQTMHRTHYITPPFVQEFRRVEAAIRALRRRGINVLRVRIGYHPKPVVWVEHSRKCEELGGLNLIARTARKGRGSTYAAVFMDCQVQWRVRPSGLKSRERAA